MKELYKIYRPKKLKDVIGQESAVSSLSKMIEKDTIPHAILLTGPSGCGKTTLARILSKKVDCGKMDLIENNCADFKGIDTIREIRSAMVSSPISGKSRVWIIDECHKLTNDAQNAFLKLLEDTPSHVYFILCTTEPNRLIKTIRNRCTEISVKSLSDKEIEKLISGVCKKEKIKLSEEVIDKIINVSEGSARKTLVVLHQIRDIKSKEEQLNAISSSISENQGITIARLLFNTKTKWKEIANVLKTIENDDAESIRWLILGYAKSVLLNGGNLSARAYQVIRVFQDNWYDCKSAGLISGCYEIISGQ
jgi:DNA polymerase III gamma/tau subunit